MGREQAVGARHCALVDVRQEQVGEARHCTPSVRLSAIWLGSRDVLAHRHGEDEGPELYHDMLV